MWILNYIKELTTPLYMKALGQTIYMTFFTTFFSYIMAIFLASFLFATKSSKHKVVKVINAVLSWIVNIARSIPFIILVMLLMSFTRLLVGKSIGTQAALVPLTIGSTPLVTRMLESSFEEVGIGKVETATSMGASKFQIMYKVIIPEAMPSIIRGLSISMISILGYTAMAGSLGGGGLGQVAYNYGYQKYNYSVIINALVWLIILVQIIQSTFNFIAKVIDKRK